jgi:hypothetical protein
MGLADGFKRFLGNATGPPAIDGIGELKIGDASYDDWPVLKDFPELEVARAWHQQLIDNGLEAVLTSDWPLDEYGRGDIALRVPPGRWSEAEEALDAPDS